MKLHYKGKYDLNPDSLPRGEHKPNAVRFKEAEDSKQMAIIANIGSVVLMVLLVIPAIILCREDFSLKNFSVVQIWLGCIMPMLFLFPHEMLHAICFKEDVYLYTNWKQGMLFVVGTETMSKARFIFMSLLPNVAFGLIPYVIGLIFPKFVFFAVFGIVCLGMGFGDYYNVFNALTQMPKGARTYLYGFNSYWYMPENK